MCGEETTIVPDDVGIRNGLIGSIAPTTISYSHDQGDRSMSLSDSNGEGSNDVEYFFLSWQIAKFLT